VAREAFCGFASRQSCDKREIPHYSARLSAFAMHGRNKRSHPAHRQGQAGGRRLSADRRHPHDEHLVQLAKFDNTQNVVFDRLLTFRGDDDAAWEHAEMFLEREILQQNVFKQPR
jgi:hypothetical protein